MVKFSSTLFIIYFSGRCLSLWMKLIIYSHMGERWMRNMYFPPSKCAYSVWRGGIITCITNRMFTDIVYRKYFLWVQLAASFSHLNLLHHLFAKWADLCRDTYSDILGSTVLAAHSVECTRTLFNVTAQVRLKRGQHNAQRVSWKWLCYANWFCVKCSYTWESCLAFFTFHADYLYPAPILSLTCSSLVPPVLPVEDWNWK